MRLSIAVIFTILIMGGVYVDEKEYRETNRETAKPNIITRKSVERKEAPSKSEICRRTINRNVGRSSLHNNSSSNNRYITFVVTAYTKNDAGMNGRGITASGKRAREHHTIAASRGYRFGQDIYFPSINRILTVEDRGGRIKGNHIDYYVLTKAEAKKWGVRKLKGVVLE